MKKQTLNAQRPTLNAEVAEVGPKARLRVWLEIDSCAPAHFDLSVFPSMSLASPRLHSFASHAYSPLEQRKK